MNVARRGLIILSLINLFNYVDRYIIAAISESLRHSSLHISDLQYGLLGSGFIVVYMATAPVFGALGDTRSRPRLIALGVTIWSVATALGGLAWSFASLLAARAMVGVGEAAYGTISPSLLADYFRKEFRGRVFGVFFLAIPVGFGLGLAIGGLMDVHFGWRSAFFVAGIPGLILAALALKLHDPPRGIQDDVTPGAAVTPGAPSHTLGVTGAVAAYRALLRNRPYVLTVLGYAAYTFALGGMALYIVKFLERVRGVSEGQASVGFAAVVIATGLIGIALGGWLSDRLLKVTKQSYLWVSGIATLIAAPLALVGVTAATPAVYWTAIVLAQLLLFASTGPVNSAIVNVVAPEIRATAVAVSIFTIHILGDVPSPTLIGAISDATSLTKAVLIIPVALLLSGAVWTYAAKRSIEA
ncbi:MAG: MFS transporter [Gemmatimonadetes bacterium 13_1_40CM_4_69_5]|nr:MAG: MFS transporter [Gemmatimonadetes bacterium 13_1_40CM_4_69_5]